MVIKNVALETVCGITSTLPKTTKMEVAFAGKSNVGKSSLINGLMNRKRLARTSAQPGKTQTINYYNVNDTFYLVDLPGYGYAKSSRNEVEKWGKMIDNYLHSSEMLYAVFLLVDIRHKPNANDLQMAEWITSNGYFPIVIATKADKISRGAIPKHVKMIKEGLQLPGETIVIPYSAITKQGRDDVYAMLDDMILHFYEEDDEQEQE